MPALVILLGCNGEDRSTPSNLEGKASIEIDGVTVLFPTSWGEKDLQPRKKGQEQFWISG